MPKPVVPRARASRDVEAAVDHYLREGGETAALGFVDAVERAWRHIARFPASGSPRCAHELDLPGLRAWPLKRYPWIVFFVERENHIDIWRVLHAHRDIPASMREPP
jgi:toxin ParE1/3/4